MRDKDKLMRDILPKASLHERAKVGRPARTYIQQICADTGCSLEDLPGTMDDRDRWREGVREIRAGVMTWWRLFQVIILCTNNLLLHSIKYLYMTLKLSHINSILWMCPWCSRYRRRNWTRRHEFKSWTRLIAFHIALIPLGKVWIQLFSLQLWVNSRTD